MPLLWRQPVHEEMRCSFCRKSQHTVGQLISNPSDYPRAFICNECVAVCTGVAEDKQDPFLGNPMLSEFLVLIEQWITRESAGQDASEELSRMRSVAQLMFPDISPRS